ncbi:ATP-dependent Clp protease ATP-binding subunit [Marinilabiliaceae bacterium JC017]|nr:ATP-dependent Clp protease ATP-binding subunit [Marinilabiliaceae bacterium JC017]
MNETADVLLTDGLKNAIHVAQAVAREYTNPEFSPAHLLKGLLHPDTGLLGTLKEWQEDIYYLDEWAEVRLESCPKAVKLPQVIPGDAGIDNVFHEAESIAANRDGIELEPFPVLVALCTPGVGFSFDQLKTLPLTREGLLNKQEVIAPGATSSGINSKGGMEPAGILQKYCVDKTTVALQNQQVQVIGRDKEILNIIEVLGRQGKPNVVITGEAGVGKSVIVDGIAKAVVSGKVPAFIKESRVLLLDTGKIMAGVSYKGELEDRLGKVLREMEKLNRPILFIDDIHVLLETSGGMQGVVHLLRSELNKGYFTLVSTTSHEGYRKHIDKDAALKRLFEVMNLDTPTVGNAVEMVKGVLPRLQEHHGLIIEGALVEEAVKLAQRHTSERKLPDSAIDLIDRTMASVRTMKDTTPMELDEMQARLEGLEKEENEADALAAFLKLIKERFSSLVTADVDDDFEGDSVAVKAQCQLALDRIKQMVVAQNGSVELSHLAATVSKISGIPIGKIMTRERDRLLGMEDALKAKVVGQDLAVTTLVEAILESRSGLNRPGQPIGSFFFLGPTGTGKTELAKQLAEFLFQSTASLIRFDMSEFKEEHSAALLYGAPPGYVGYEEGGMLVNKIRQQPYSVVLFDEIEKAHPSVFDIFLQILDEGKLNDRLGKTGDFSNAVVLFTSNIGSQSIVEQFNNEGILPASNDLMAVMSSHFRPEFLGRLTGIVPFAPITKENVGLIFDLQLKELTTALELQDITLTLTAEARQQLAEEGYSPRYGARPLRNVIRTRLRTPLSRMIISGQLNPGSEVHVALDDQQTPVFDIQRNGDWDDSL